MQMLEVTALFYLYFTTYAPVFIPYSHPFADLPGRDASAIWRHLKQLNHPPKSIFFTYIICSTGGENVVCIFCALMLCLSLSGRVFPLMSSVKDYRLYKYNLFDLTSLE